MAAITEMPLADRNQAFLDAEAKIDDAIQIRQTRKKSMWRSMIARGTYVLGEGLEKKAYRFFPGLSQQRGLHLWHPVQISRKPSAGDSGFDATKYNPHTVNYGFDSFTYGGMGIEYKTPHISIRDLRFMWQVKQQLMAVYSYLGDFTNDMWENYNREQYAARCNSAGNCYAIVDGIATGQSFTYDPESVDTDGDNILTVAGDGAVPDIGILDWEPLKYFSRYMEMQCPTAAVGNLDGRPSYGWIGDLQDFDTMIQKDPELREDWRYARAQALIDNYGHTTTYKGFSLMHDMLTPRFAIKKKSSNSIILKRVDPMVATSATLIGQRTDVNPDYLNAEFGCFFIFLKDVFSVEVPPSGPANPGGKTSFGAAPGLNGEWKWLNYQTDDNPLMEKGYWFMRAEAFAKPGEFREEPVMVLYRRFVHNDAQDTEIGGSEAQSEQDIIVDVASGDVDSTNYTIEVTLAGYLTAEADQSISLVADDASTIAGIIADSSNAPVYTLALDSAPTYSDYTASGGAKVVVA